MDTPHSRARALPRVPFFGGATVQEVVAVVNVLDAIRQSDIAAFEERLEVVKTICNGLDGYVYPFYLSVFAMHTVTTRSTVIPVLRTLITAEHGGARYGALTAIPNFVRSSPWNPWKANVDGAKEATETATMAAPTGTAWVQETWDGVTKNVVDAKESLGGMVTEHGTALTAAAAIVAATGVMAYFYNKHKRRSTQARSAFFVTMGESLLDGDIPFLIVPKFLHDRIELYLNVLRLDEVHARGGYGDLPDANLDRANYRVYGRSDEGLRPSSPVH